MNKPFATIPTERDRQIKTYVMNRKSMVYSSLDYPIEDFLVPDKFFFDVSDTPKLQRLFFYCYFYKLQGLSQKNRTL